MSHSRNLARIARKGVITVDTAQELRNLPIYGGMYPEAVQTLGADATDDDGGGLWVWDAASTEADNLGTVLESAGVATGRWVRVIEDETVYFEWFGLVGLDSGDNAAIVINDTLLWAWQNQFGKVSVKKARTFHLWGGGFVSNVEVDFKFSTIKPWNAPTLENPAGDQVFLFGHGIAVVQCNDVVAYYNMPGESIWNLMEPDTTAIGKLDYRHLHPNSPSYMNAPFFPFIDTVVFPPRSAQLQVVGPVTLVPGDIVAIMSPRYTDRIDQAISELNIVAKVDGDVVTLLWPTCKRHRKDVSDTVPAGATVPGGIGKFFDNSVIVNSVVKNFNVDCTEQAANTSVSIWMPHHGYNCRLENVRVFGGNYQWAFWPKGAHSLIKDCYISGQGKLSACEQFNSHAVWENNQMILESWTPVAPLSSCSFLHTSEAAHFIFRNNRWTGPEIPTTAYNSPAICNYSASGCVVENNYFHNVDIGTLFGFVQQYDGWGSLQYNNNVIRGWGHGYAIAATGLGNPSKEIALQAHNNDILITEVPDKLTSGVPRIKFSSGVLAVATNNRLQYIPAGQTEPVNLDNLTCTSNFNTSPPGATAITNLEANDLWRFVQLRNNYGFAVAERNSVTALEMLAGTGATYDKANQALVLVDAANAAFYVPVNVRENSVPVSLFMQLQVSTDGGVGGDIYLTVGVYASTKADPTKSYRSNANLVATILAVAGVQTLALDKLWRDATNLGLVGPMVFILTRQGAHASDTLASSLYVHGVDVTALGGY